MNSITRQTRLQQQRTLLLAAGCANCYWQRQRICGTVKCYSYCADHITYVICLCSYSSGLCADVPQTCWDCASLSPHGAIDRCMGVAVAPKTTQQQCSRKIHMQPNMHKIQAAASCGTCCGPVHPCHDSRQAHDIWHLQSAVRVARESSNCCDPTTKLAPHSLQLRLPRSVCTSAGHAAAEDRSALARAGQPGLRPAAHHDACDCMHYACTPGNQELFTTVLPCYI